LIILIDETEVRDDLSVSFVLISDETEKEDAVLNNDETEEQDAAIAVVCELCDEAFTDRDWCHNCESKNFRFKFSRWTTGNSELDEAIQESQLDAKKRFNYFEWIPYDQFEEIHPLTEARSQNVLSAIWREGPKEQWSDKCGDWVGRGHTDVVLNSLRNKQPISKLVFVVCFNYHYCYTFIDSY